MVTGGGLPSICKHGVGENRLFPRIQSRMERTANLFRRGEASETDEGLREFARILGLNHLVGDQRLSYGLVKRCIQSGGAAEATNTGVEGEFHRFRIQRVQALECVECVQGGW